MSRRRRSGRGAGAAGWCDRQWRRFPFVDAHSGDISITRSLAIYFAWVDGQEIGKNGVTMNALWLALACLAAAFGKSTFTFLIDRKRCADTPSIAPTQTITDPKDP